MERGHRSMSTPLNTALVLLSEYVDIIFTLGQTYVKICIHIFILQCPEVKRIHVMIMVMIIVLLQELKIVL